MPPLKRRPTSGPGKSAQIRKGGGNTETLQGKSTFDGRLNTKSGTKHSALPSTLEGKAVVVRTYGA